MRRSRTEAEQYIRAFLEDSGGRWDWDDFISIPIDDPEVDKIRRAAIDIRDRFPPTREEHYCSEEGVVELQKLADRLRK